MKYSWPEDSPDHHRNRPDDGEEDDIPQTNQIINFDNLEDSWNRFDNSNVYVLLTQDATNNAINDDDDDDWEDDDDDDDDPNIQNGDQQNVQMYRQSYQVEWIETDEPLFDPTASRTINNNHETDSESSSVPEPPKESVKDSEKETETPTNKDNNDTKLDEIKINTIKNLMANFKLPDEHYPNWAKNIPEDEWKKCLNNKLKKDV